MLGIAAIGVEGWEPALGPTQGDTDGVKGCFLGMFCTGGEEVRSGGSPALVPTNGVDRDRLGA